MEISPEIRKFEGFLEFMGEAPEGMTLDRIDGSKGYVVGNLRWASKKTQARNRRTNKLLTCNGKTQTLTEWSEQTGIPRSRIEARIGRYGWPVEKAISAGRYSHVNTGPNSNRGNPKISETDAREIKSSSEPRRQLAERFGVSVGTVNGIKAGRVWKHLSDTGDVKPTLTH